MCIRDRFGNASPGYKLDVSGSFRATSESTFASNLLFPDAARIKLGTDQDLQIYHDGSNSYIDETGAGDLYIKAVDDIWMQSGTDVMGRFNSQGVKLYYLNTSKIETVSSGVKLPVAGDGITLVSPDGNTTRTISIDNSGNLVVSA